MNKSIFLFILKDNKFLSIVDSDNCWTMPGLQVEHDNIEALCADNALSEFLNIEIENPLFCLYSGLLLNKRNPSRSSWATTFMFDATDVEVDLTNVAWRPMSDLMNDEALFKDYNKKVYENYYLSKNPVFLANEPTF